MSRPEKRESSSALPIAKRVDAKIKLCIYGDGCYRKNPEHFKEYFHPHLEKYMKDLEEGKDIKLPERTRLTVNDVLEQIQLIQGGAGSEFQISSHPNTAEFIPPRDERSNVKQSSSSTEKSKSTKGRVNEKLAKAAPFNFFLTAVTDSRPTLSEPLTIAFYELLDHSLGELDSSLQINFMVELDWVLGMYNMNGYKNKPLLILHGEDSEQFRNPSSLPSNVTAVRVKPPHPFGHHHSKMSIFYYHDGGIRVVVSTANLIDSDWDNRTQGVWVSPLCPLLSFETDTSAGESPTEFKADLLRYLAAYRIPQLQDWISRVRRADFSAVRVFFVSSFPGTHRGTAYDLWGHRRLASLLRKHASLPGSPKDWSIVAQCSSIGSLGPEPESWMCGELRTSFAQAGTSGSSLLSLPQFKVVYPSFQNVVDSLDGILGGGCLPYSNKTHQKQTWFTRFLHEWKSDKRHRSGAVPHIKSYTRISPASNEIAWFHLTSANLSKAAWGYVTKATNKSSSGLNILSYETGVLFLPKFLTGSQVFNLKDEKHPFPVPYDLPLSPYKSSDKPWVQEYMM